MTDADRLAALLRDVLGPLMVGSTLTDAAYRNIAARLIAAGVTLAPLPSYPSPGESAGFDAEASKVAALLRRLAARWWTAPGMTEMATFPDAEAFAAAIVGTLVPTPPDAPDVRNPCSCGHTDGQHYEGCLECDRQYREHGMADRD
jgi:hypothetical protein